MIDIKYVNAMNFIIIDLLQPRHKECVSFWYQMIVE